MGLYGPGGIPDDGNAVLAGVLAALQALIDDVLDGAVPAVGSVVDASVAVNAAIAQAKVMGLVADLAALVGADAAEASTRAMADTAETNARVAADATKLALAGGTLTGALVLAADGAAALNPTTRQQFDAGLATKEPSIPPGTYAAVAEINVKTYAATAAQKAVLGNDTSKPLSGFYATLPLAQAAYPHALALTDELEWAVIQAALNAATGPGAITTTRKCLNAVYVPAGIYKSNRPLTIKSVQGFQFHGAGRDVTFFHPLGALDSFLDIDGCSNGNFGDFTVSAPVGSLVDKAVALDWSGPGVIGRSTSSNVIRHIVVNGEFKYGIAVGTRSGNFQVDDTSIYNCLVTGQWVLDSLNTTKWQAGFRLGNGSSGNVIGNFLYDCSAVLLKYGVDAAATNFQIWGCQSAANQSDFYQTGAAAYVSIDGVRSEGSRRLWEDVGTAATQVTKISNVNWNANGVVADGTWIKESKSGHLLLENIHYGAGLIAPVISIQATGDNPLSVTAIGVAQPATLTAGFVVGPATSLVLANYLETNATNNIVSITTAYVRNGAVAGGLKLKKSTAGATDNLLELLNESSALASFFDSLGRLVVDPARTASATLGGLTVLPSTATENILALRNLPGGTGDFFRCFDPTAAFFPFRLAKDGILYSTDDTNVVRYNQGPRGADYYEFGTSTAHAMNFRVGGTYSTRWEIDGNVGLNLNFTGYGGGVGVVGIKSATTVPTTDPVGGGVLYVEAGVLKFRASTGAIFNTTRQAAQADTTGAALAALETEVNGLKAKLRAAGLMA